MDDDLDLKDFTNVCRLFPLPGVVLFPHAVLPLHIFEPRYRQMTEDALATDRLIAIVQLRPMTAWDKADEPPIEAVGCLGRIFKYERLPDGRFNFLLVGRKRIKLVREVDNGKLYRSSEVAIIDDVAPTEAGERRRGELISLFRKAHQGQLDPDLDALFDSDLPLGILTDIITHALGLPPDAKQAFLAEPSVDRRVRDLMNQLRRERVDDSPGPSCIPFPPPFSRN